MSASAPHSCTGDVGAAAAGRRAPAPAPQEDTAAAGRTRGGGAGLQGGHHRSCTCCGRSLAASGLPDRDGAAQLRCLRSLSALLFRSYTRSHCSRCLLLLLPPNISFPSLLETPLPRSVTRSFLCPRHSLVNRKSFLHVASLTESPDGERDSFASHLSHPHATHKLNLCCHHQHCPTTC